MAVKDIFANVPMGAVSLVFDATANGALESVEVDNALDDEDATLTVPIEAFGLTYTNHSGKHEGRQYISDDGVTLTVSVPLNVGQLTNLSNLFVKNTGETAVGIINCAEVLYGTLKIHPLCMGSDTSLDVEGYKVSCTPTITGSYKNNEKVMATLLFEFCSDDDKTSPTYGKVLSFGKFVVDPPSN
jgi:hypothetical protein